MISRVDKVFSCLDGIVHYIFDGKIYCIISTGDDSEFPLKRDFAYAHELDDAIEIVVAPKLHSQEMDRIVGVISHEFGHAVDMKIKPRQLYSIIGDLPDVEQKERRADAIAEKVFDLRISYDGDHVQTVGKGIRPRPAGLGL